MGTKMQSIVHPINLLVETEYQRAERLYGGVFASGHEGYGVIAEEVLEAEDEMQYVERNLVGLLRSLRGSDKQSVMDWADAVRDVAVNAAAELIQVAAMCQKMVKTMEDA